MAGVGRKPSTGQAAASEPDERAFAAMATRAKALIPQLRDRAARTEELRRLPPETERDLHEAGLFRIVQPKRGGGSEFDYVALVDCAELLGRGDASVAWNFGNLASHHWMLGMFDKRAQDLVWNKNPDALIASSSVSPPAAPARLMADTACAAVGRFRPASCPASGTCSPAWFPSTMRPM